MKRVCTHFNRSSETYKCAKITKSRGCAGRRLSHEKKRERKERGNDRICVCVERGERQGWFLIVNVAPPRQKAAEERDFSSKGCEEAGELARHAEVRRRKDEEAPTATGVERTGAKREGGGKAGRPGIDRLKKGWIFLPLGGGPAV